MQVQKKKLYKFIALFGLTSLIVFSQANASQTGPIVQDGINYNTVDSLVNSSDLLSLRKALKKDRQLVKRALLSSLDKKMMSDFSELNNFLENITALDIKTGSYLQTARVFLNLVRMGFTNSNPQPDAEILNSIIRQSDLFFSVPIGTSTSSLVFTNILSDPEFVAFLSYKKGDFFLEFRKSNTSDISGSLNLLGELDLAQVSAEVLEEIRQLMLQIIESNKAHRNIFEDKFLKVVPLLASNIEQPIVRSSISNAFASFILDRMEAYDANNSRSLYSKLKQYFPEYAGIKNFEKFFYTKKDKVTKKATQKSYSNKSFLANTGKTQTSTHSSFPFGLVFILAAAFIGFVFYRRQKRVLDPLITGPSVGFGNNAEKKEQPKFEELADFDEQLGLA